LNSLLPNILANLLHNLQSRFPWRTSDKRLGNRAIVRLPYLLSHRGTRETFLLQIIRLLRGLGLHPEFLIFSIADYFLITAAIGRHGEYRSIGFRLRCPLRSAAKLTLACDDLTPEKLLSHPWKLVLRFAFNLSRPRLSVPHAMFVPFPDRSIGHLHAHIPASRNRKRLMRCFFSGAWRGYEGHEVGALLGMMERADIVGVYKSFPGTYVLRSERELQDILSGEILSPIGFYLVDTDCYRIPQAQWFHVLGHAHTFLAPPGVRHPLCHNIVEAMAVGAIPITNYPQWFHPPLEDGMHCFAFQSYDDLLETLALVRDMPSEQLEVMHQAVLAYYDAFLDPIRFRGRLGERLPAGMNTVHLVMAAEITDYFPRLGEDSLAYGTRQWR
jgi:hypothetical protein